MRLRTLARGWAMAVGTVGVLLLGGGVAQAQPTQEGQHCVAVAGAEQVECFGTAEEAARAGSGSYLLLQVWLGDNYTGLSIGFYFPTTCTAAYDDEPDKWPDLRDVTDSHLDINDDIRSWQTNYSCRVRFYDDIWYEGGQSPLSYVGVDCRYMASCFGSANWLGRASSFGLT